MVPETEGVQLAFATDAEKAVAAINRLGDRVNDLQVELDLEWDTLGREIHPINAEKGFWGPPEMMDKYQAKLMLVVTEVAEVTEALRKSQGAFKVTEEFADIFIRALDLYTVLVDAGEAEPGLLGILMDKVSENANRPPKHGNRWG